MKFIIVDNRSGKARSFSANGILLGLAIAGLVGIPVAAGHDRIFKTVYKSDAPVLWLPGLTVGFLWA